MQADWSAESWQDAAERAFKECAPLGVHGVTVWNRGKDYARPHLQVNMNTRSGHNLLTLGEYQSSLREFVELYSINAAYYRVDFAINLREPFSKIKPLACYLSDVMQAAYTGKPSYYTELPQPVTQIGWNATNIGLSAVVYDKAACDIAKGQCSGYSTRIEFRQVFKGQQRGQIGAEADMVDAICADLDKAMAQTDRAIAARTAALIAEYDGYQLQPRELVTFVKMRKELIYSRKIMEDLYYHVYPSPQRKRLTDWLKRHQLDDMPLYAPETLVQWVDWMQAKLHQFGVNGA